MKSSPIRMTLTQVTHPQRNQQYKAPMRTLIQVNAWIVRTLVHASARMGLRTVCARVNVMGVPVQRFRARAAMRRDRQFSQKKYVVLHRERSLGQDE